ncbi:MAG: xanthine dehydrogenase family protein molybdopterin-binding subunit [Myxococcota bacterium]|jgi:CO/xanthine dehydrogenase Mo-binding subunit|nr:xanthine dehydrogenase family protein molybdopterin-binding subunit [Myxococcota bacterium]
MSVFRNDAVAKVCGAAKYADDYTFPGMLHAAPVYGDEVHARILQLDTSRAAAAPGVVRVLTAADVPGHSHWGQLEHDLPIFASTHLRSHGDVVALVVATSREQAIAAAELVELRCEPLPAVTDLRQAFESNQGCAGTDGNSARTLGKHQSHQQKLVYPEKGSNIANHHKLRHGDVDAAFAHCTHRLQRSFSTQAIEHAYMEPEAAVVVPRSDGVLEIFGSMQHPFSTRQFTAALLAVPLSEIEVYTIPVGGGFGGKDDTAAVVCARAALAAKLLQRPVKLTYLREWSMRESYKRHPYLLDYELGLSSDGRILAARIRMLADSGPYLSVTPFVTWRSIVHCCGPYVVPNVHCDVYGVYTNNIFSGAMRGFGSPQVNFAIEQLIEIAAQELDIEPLELRRRNMVHQDCITVTGQRLSGHTVSLSQALDSVLERIGYHEKRARCSYGEGDELYGIGLAMCYRGMSLGSEGTDMCSAIINGQFDGSILLETGIHENGQGSESAMILALSEALGVRRERIRYRRGSTSSIPDSATTVASRGTLMGTSAVVCAAEKLKSQMAKTLAELLRCEPEQVEFRDDALWGGATEEGQARSKLSWDEAVWQLYLRQQTPFAYANFQAPAIDWDEEHGQGNAYFTWVYGCQAAEVLVDKRTGKVRVTNMVAAHDVGKAYNPPMVLGQIYGGITQALGYALSEDFLMKDGRVQSDNFHKYRIPKATDVPELTAIILENPDPASASHAKGIGEPALELGAAAIANALHAATGQRFFSLPMKPAPTPSERSQA